VWLCSTCRHHAACSLRRQNDFHPIYCEEFEAPIVVDGRAGKEKERQREREPAAGDNTFQGLCRNCRNRHSCRFAGCEGGIWHCEEYQ